MKTEPVAHESFHHLSATAAGHLQDILSLCLEYSPSQKAVIVADAGCPLASILSAAWQRCLPDATFINFDAVRPEEVLAAFAPLKPADLVILIQSTSFRLQAFRIRVELFQRGLKVLEHPHLARMQTLAEQTCYIDSLAYDPSYYRKTGRALKTRIDQASCGFVDSGTKRLLFDCPFEPAKLNIGDYTGMNNIGGQFPIGEVFTEASQLEAVHGKIRIFAFADTTYSVNRPDKPVTLVIEQGKVRNVFDSTAEFDRVLANIRADEGEVWVRELGFGMNRAFTPERIVPDIGTYERMCGIHLSLGMKHTVYNKPAFRPRKTRHHVDVFAITHTVQLDEEVVFQQGAWTV